ncbi:MAG TPA: DUF1761 domain-containing protein [Xanthobacteraceae bacterium]|nr:DUF1761 domain-containing protein [Xanthobacteraceae bacterium]
MSFAGINYVAVAIAAVAAWLAGAAWYGALAKPWVAAQGKTMEEFKAAQAAKHGSPADYGPFVIAFVAELVMAWALAGMVGHLGPGQVTLRNGVISAVFLWLGFVVTTLAVNYAFAGRGIKLAAIDAGHWLVVLLVEGAVVGAMGV